METITLSPEKLNVLIGMFSLLPKEFIEKALLWEDKIVFSENKNIKSYADAEDAFFESEINSLEEKLAVWHMVLYSQNKEQLVLSWTRIREEDIEGTVMTIRQMALIMSPEGYSEENDS